MRSSFLLLAILLATTAKAQSPPQPGFFADVQMLWFDSEYNTEYELAPRFILGYDDVVGARARYWTYDHARELHQPLTTNFSGIDRTIRLDFDVIDLEATTHIRHENSDILLSGGARLAHIDYNWYQVATDWLDRDAGTTQQSSSGTAYKTDLGGLTFAAEGRTRLVSTLSAVYGGRLSMLKGFWEGSVTQSETFFVPECFAGVEAQIGRVFTRVSAEFQEWDGRSRVGMTNLNFVSSRDFGFTGYGFDLGFVF